MQSAASLLGEDGPPIVDVTELDFETDDATFAPSTTLDVDADVSSGTHPAGTSPGPANRGEPQSTGDSDTPHHDAGQRAGGAEATASEGDSQEDHSQEDHSQEDELDPARQSHEEAVSPPEDTLNPGAADRGDSDRAESGSDDGEPPESGPESHEEVDPDVA
jgi:hypothetical protein